MQVKYDLVVDFARPTKSNTIILSEGDVNSRVCHFVLLNNKAPFSMGDVTVATVRGVKKNGALVFGEAEFLYDEAGNKINEIDYVIPAAIADEAGDVTMTITLMSSEGEQITSFEFYLKVRNALFNEDDMISDSDLSGFRDLLNRTTAALEKMEAMTEADALPNPFALDIEIEGEHTVYTGDEPKEISLNNMAYIDEGEDVVIEDALDESAAKRAAEAAQSASESKNAIELLVNQAGEVADVMGGYRNDTLQYKNDAENSKLRSIQAEVSAERYKAETESYKNEAEEYKNATESYKNDANTSKNKSSQSALVSEGYAIGTQNGTAVGSESPYYHNNAKWFSENSDVSNTNKEVASLSEYLTQLSETIEEKFIDKEDAYSNNDISTITDGYANTARWFLDVTIPKGRRIDSIEIYSRRYVADVITIDVWNDNGTTLELVKTISINSNGIGFFTADIGYKTLDNTRISVSGTQNNLIAYNTNGTTKYIKDKTSTSLTVSSLSTLSNNGCIAKVSVSYEKELFPSNVIFVGETGKYRQIQDALEGITDDSEDNRYTIIVLPSEKPYEWFSTVRKKNGAYPWSNVSPRYISIIGMDKASCVIKNDSGSYEEPCAEMMINGFLKNLTFIMTSENQSQSASKGGYCIHIDCRTKDDVGYDFTIEDCDFYNDSAPCLGIGMHKNTHLKIRRCNFETTLDESYKPYASYVNLYDYGCVYMHSSQLAEANNQKIEIVDCVGVCKDGNYSLKFDKTPNYSEGALEYTLLRNVFWNESINASGYKLPISFDANPMNFGNNN